MNMSDVEVPQWNVDLSFGERGKEEPKSDPNVEQRQLERDRKWGRKMEQHKESVKYDGRSKQVK